MFKSTIFPTIFAYTIVSGKIAATPPAHSPQIQKASYTLLSENCWTNKCHKFLLTHWKVSSSKTNKK